MRGGGRLREDCNGGPEGWGGSDRLGHSSHRIHPARPRPPGFSWAFPRDRGRCFPAAPAPPGLTPASRVARLHLQESTGHRPLPVLPGMGGSGQQTGMQAYSAWSGHPTSTGLPPIRVLPPLAVASEQAELRGLLSPGAALRFSCPDPGQGRGRSRAGVISSQYGQNGGREHRWRKWGPLARPRGQSQGCGALGLRGWLSPACGSPRR